VGRGRWSVVLAFTPISFSHTTSSRPFRTTNILWLRCRPRSRPSRVRRRHVEDHHSPSHIPCHLESTRSLWEDLISLRKALDSLTWLQYHQFTSYATTRSTVARIALDFHQSSLDMTDSTRLYFILDQPPLLATFSFLSIQKNSAPISTSRDERLASNNHSRPYEFKRHLHSPCPAIETIPGPMNQLLGLMSLYGSWLHRCTHAPPYVYSAWNDPTLWEIGLGPSESRPASSCGPTVVGVLSI